MKHPLPFRPFVTAAVILTSLGLWSGSSRAAGIGTPPTGGQMPPVVLQKVEYTPDYAAISRSFDRNPPFVFKGDGTSGRVEDRDGHVLMESGKTIGIFGASVSPDKRRVLVKGGNAINFVLGPATGEKIQLPVTPPGVHLLGFGSWYWIDDHRLVGESGIAKVDEDGKPVRSEANVAQSKLYVYDILTKVLQEVVLPAGFDGKVFAIIETSPDGYLKIGVESPVENKSGELAWFKIGPP